MKIFDMHIHRRIHGKNILTPAEFVAEMEAAGLYGGCVYSERPLEFDAKIGADFEQRIDDVLYWTKDYPGRLFPILWIHPDEEDILNKIDTAIQKGICGFKIICGDFYVYEEKCMRVLRHIASRNKPVIFHTGILWDGQVSSAYNRPINFEALIDIEGLRFSMGHCSWPWVDECIALYGKFLNALNRRNTAEMFFDITPGTPEIYRRDLLFKLFNIGYDVEHNIMFGTDSLAESYRGEWTKKWLKIDNEIMDDLGVSRACRENIYYNNLLRFLGITTGRPEFASPDIDDSNPCSAVNPEVEKAIEKWYLKLNFPKEYNKQFYNALQKIKISDCLTPESFGEGKECGKRNLLTYLYFAELLAKQYAEKGIDEKILLDTLSDIVLWTNVYSDIKGELYLGELNWLIRHLTMKLFKIGRLQFCMATAGADINKYGIKKGDNVIEVHIPSGAALNIDDCKASIKSAKEFFAKHFPEFDYKFFTCDSWLLDDTLKTILNEGSNILKFQSLFDIVHQAPSNSILKYTFNWNINERTVKDAVPASGFAEKVKKAFLSGTQFNEGLGIIEK